MSSNTLNCLVLGFCTALVIVLNYKWSKPSSDLSELDKLEKAEETISVLSEEPMEVVGLLTDFDYTTCNFVFRTVAYLFYLGWRPEAFVQIKQRAITQITIWLMDQKKADRASPEVKKKVVKKRVIKAVYDYFFSGLFQDQRYIFFFGKKKVSSIAAMPKAASSNEKIKKDSVT